jgi:tetratricopeptide (TPR) repeat protein
MVFDRGPIPNLGGRRRLLRGSGFRPSRGCLLAVAVTLALAAPTLGQQSRAPSDDQRGKTPAPTIDDATGRVLNQAIEALNAGNYEQAQTAIATLKLEKLSPYERSRVEQISFNISYSQEKYEDARAHLERAIAAGGLNEQEISGLRYQIAQLYVVEERWKEGAAALEDWLATATNPNSAAFFMLAVAYYRLEDFDRALPPAEKAVELMDKPQENWIGMLLALYMQKDRYKEAIPLLKRVIELVPDKKSYWLQLSGVYGQIEDYANALAVMQLAYGAGLLTEDSELRRLADLLLFNDIPFRGAQVLENAIEKHRVNLDDKLYEKLATCWIAAGELDRSIEPLQRAAELSSSGDLFVRLGEVHIQRRDWGSAETALERGLSTGQLKDAAGAQALMGIVLYSQKRLTDARAWFQRARQSPKHRQVADTYLQAIEAELPKPPPPPD